jgi:hypothetical protein
MFILTSVLLYKRARKGKTRFYDEEGDLTPVQKQGTTQFYLIFCNKAIFFWKSFEPGVPLHRRTDVSMNIPSRVFTFLKHICSEASLFNVKISWKWKYTYNRNICLLSINKMCIRIQSTNRPCNAVYPLFLQCCTGNEVCKGPISFSLWRLQMQCSDDVSMCRDMSSIWWVSVYPSSPHFSIRLSTNIDSFSTTNW